MSRPVPQLELALGPYRNVRLFSEHFLFNRLPDWDEFAAAGSQGLFDELRRLWYAERGILSAANEAQTEERFIKPVLDALGFSYTVQAGVDFTGGRRQPDYALFLDERRRAEAERRGGDARYEDAAAVADAKRFDRSLERRRSSGAATEDPVAQIINYVFITRCRFGILTNGRLWRLYAADGGLVERACFEVDLVARLESGDLFAFRYFAAFFAAEAFRLDADGRSFLDRALDESQANAIAVGEALERQVFAAVPAIAEGLVGHEQRSGDVLAEAFDHALVLLYRLLFCLHAEAHRLLPVDNPHYQPNSVGRQRRRVAEDIDRGRIFGGASDEYYHDLRVLFRMLARGDPAIDVNEYDGGLFSAAHYPYFSGRSIPDALLAPALDRLYRVEGRSVDYRDLSVRHLGTIYERLLDFRLEEAEDGSLRLTAAPGRRESGSYFTPQYVVDAIVERTLEPILLATSRDLVARGLRGAYALEAFLRLSVLDPAMGSGHFLVSAGAYVAQFIATDPSYDGDLPLVEIQRLVTERCLYGVDVNPLAVELARVSLWLTTVRGDEPLTFINNLRSGNSLVGAELADLLAGEGSIFAARLAEEAAELLRGIEEIGRERSTTGHEVHRKEQLAEAVETLRRPLEAHADETLSPAFSNGVGDFVHWELEFPEVFLTAEGRSREDGGFDAVVGNPPYVRIQALGRQLADYCRRRYTTASGAFDAYVPFIERSVTLLNDRGRLGFIVPNKLFKLDYGARLRAMFAEHGLVEDIVDFGDAQLFEGATNYTCILTLVRAGARELTYRRVRGDAAAIRLALQRLESTPSERFELGGLGSDPWVLATGEEAAVLRTAASGAARLDEVTQQIFQGLITSADSVYILEDRGQRGGLQRVYSPASEVELELEPDLLHPLATGRDVARYAFEPLSRLLLFPYRREGEAMRLLTADELSQLPLSEAYLRGHENDLRARERSRMDHDGWYGFGRHQSLGAHDLPKLGVAETVRSLEVAADLDGAVYFHNVRVNGILLRPDGPPIATLLLLLNSKPLDFVFRRISVPHAGNHYAANKQFIAPLPIQVPEGASAAELDALGRRLHDAAAGIAAERGAFLAWLEGLLEARLADLNGSTTLHDYERGTAGSLLSVLSANRNRIEPDPDSRSFRERFSHELSSSVERLTGLRHQLQADEATAQDLVYDLYELTAAQRALVERDHARTGPSLTRPGQPTGLTKP